MGTDQKSALFQPKAISGLGGIKAPVGGQAKAVVEKAGGVLLIQGNVLFNKLDHQANKSSEFLQFFFCSAAASFPDLIL